MPKHALPFDASELRRLARPGCRLAHAAAGAFAFEVRTGELEGHRNRQLPRRRVSLLRGKVRPLRGLHEIALAAFAGIGHPREVELRVGVPEDRGRVVEKLARPRLVGLDPATRYALPVVRPEADDGVRHVGRRLHSDLVVGGIGHDIGEKLEGLQVVAGDAVALGVHVAELPLRAGHALAGRKAQRLNGGQLVAAVVLLQPVRECLARRRLRRQVVDLESEGRPGRKRHNQHSDTQRTRCPHRSSLPPHRRGESPRL